MHRQPQPATVFLVDDDPSVLRAVGRLVRSAGWNAATFNSAREFLEKQDPDAPGCLVLDVTMPGFDGLVRPATSACAFAALSNSTCTNQGFRLLEYWPKVQYWS